jgi:phosphatidate cytidylyltransferase
MLLPRLITAIIGIPLILLSVYWGGIPFFFLILAVMLFSLWEFFLMVEAAGYQTMKVTGMAAGFVLFLSIFLNSAMSWSVADNQGTPAILSILLIPFFAVEFFRRKPERAIERVGITFFGAFLIPWSLGHLLLIRDLRPEGMGYVYLLFITTWFLDTGAYAIGKRWGRIPLLASVSPKKTVEGFLGGVVTGCLTAIACKYIFLNNAMTLSEAALVGILLALVGQFSDLAESLLKRDAGIKDSANLLPGHGGMLDRFDSYLFAAPVFYYFLTILHK